MSDCLARNLPLSTQPVGAEGSVLGATGLVNLQIVIEASRNSMLCDRFR